LADKPGQWLALGECLMQVVERKVLRGCGFFTKKSSSEYMWQETTPEMFTAVKGKKG
jgi:hypothetical protein